ncbi:MAG: hypothetical protein L6R40_005341 [Gallowayella cf. fulva]|nr:MAG: hypothetical protein L6R40_005341 [Xanthomendoza cf. fulva]
MSRTMSPSAPATSLFSELVAAVFTGDSWKLAIPASLYVLQNSLQYYAISNLDAATFQITYQFKILPTALFSIVLLRRRLTSRQWFALGLLIVGVVIVQKPAADTASIPPLKDPHTGYHFPWALGGFRGVGTPALAPLSKRSATYEGIQEDDVLEHPKVDSSTGIAAALMGCVVSSLASVYFEKILKDAVNPVSLWVRNVQLSFYSMFPALFIGIFYMDGEKVARDGFFAGYNWVVWTVLILQAIGGMVVSLAVKHSDNISKSFAMSISILISLCASIVFFDFKMTTTFVLGSLVVTIATVLYSQRERRIPPAPIRIHDFEKTTIDPKSAKERSTPMRHPQDVVVQAMQHKVPIPAVWLSQDQALLDAPDESRRQMGYEGNRGHAQATRSQQRFSDDLFEERQSNDSDLRHPFQTPPSQLAPAPSSLTYPAPSSPLASVVQRREAQASQSSAHHNLPTEPTSPFPSFRKQTSRDSSSTSNLRHAPPVVQGIQLVSPNELPDRYRSVFPYPLFNAVQSKCFATAYQTSDNLVLSAPTGSGKTVVLELSICRLISGFQSGQFKIVYMAPTKSLCSERQKDWQAKFASLDLHCAELTGDTDHGQLRMVQSASIIITTPEKWDSVSRKWKDHAKLMQLVRLFLIDEVHILKETRGACLEAVVSRMKWVGSNVRFIALSATVPNSDDIATWLHLNNTTEHLPACREIFGEEFRPVKLQKHVYGLSFAGNDWGFDKVCDPK